MQLTNLIGSNVYSVYECEKVGFVVAVSFNKHLNKLENIFVANDENDESFTVNVRNIYRINGNTVLIKNNTKLAITSTPTNNLINQSILNFNGAEDVVKEVELDENFNVTSILGNHIKLSPENVICNKNNIILCNTTEEKFSRRTFRPRSKINKQNVNKEQSVKILENEISKPTHITGNNAMLLLGKHLTQSLYDNGNVVAYKNSIVTHNTVEMCKQLNILDKLSELVK